MDAEREVRLVVAHPERGGGDDGLDLVAPELLLDVDARRRLEPAGVGGDLEPGRCEERGEPLRLGDGERVHDA